MPTAPVALILVLDAVALASIFLSAYSFSQRRVRCAAEFSLFMAGVAVYAIGYSVELSRTTLEGIREALRFEYLGIVLIPTVWVLFARHFTRGKKEGLPTILLLSVIPALTLAMVFTSDRHDLFYRHAHLRADVPFAVFGFDFGPFYLLWALYLQGCIAWGTILMVRHALKAGALLRRQSATIALAAFIPWIAFIGHLLSWWPLGLDSGPFSAGISGFLFGFAIFRFGLLELVPKARDRALDGSLMGFLVVDRRGILLDANPSARVYLGLGEAPVGDPLPAGLAGRAGRESLLDLAVRGEGSLELSVPLPEGRPCSPGGGVPFGSSCLEAPAEPPTELRLKIEASPLRGGRGLLGASLMVTDITEVSALLARLDEQASTDALTGLPNRRRFFEIAHREIEVVRRGYRPVTVCIADLDHFKAVNDGHGHDAGDAFLREASARFTGALRAADLVCRYGGEEFAFLFTGCGPEEGLTAAERLRERLAAGPIVHGGLSLPLTASFGTATSAPGQEADLEVLLRRADEALYAAKAGGRDRVVAWKP